MPIDEMLKIIEDSTIIDDIRDMVGGIIFIDPESGENVLGTILSGVWADTLLHYIGVGELPIDCSNLSKYAPDVLVTYPFKEDRVEVIVKKLKELHDTYGIKYAVYLHAEEPFMMHNLDTPLQKMYCKYILLSQVQDSIMAALEESLQECTQEKPVEK